MSGHNPREHNPRKHNPRNHPLGRGYKHHSRYPHQQHATSKPCCCVLTAQMKEAYLVVMVKAKFALELKLIVRRSRECAAGGGGNLGTVAGPSVVLGGLHRWA